MMKLKKHMQNRVGTSLPSPYDPEELHGKITPFVTPSLKSPN